jgi:hypothetical protein
VGDPVRHFPPLFEFIHLPFDERFVAGVRGGSVRKAAFPAITAEVAALCDAMTERLEKTLIESPEFRPHPPSPSPNSERG